VGVKWLETPEVTATTLYSANGSTWNVKPLENHSADAAAGRNVTGATAELAEAATSFRSSTNWSSSALYRLSHSASLLSRRSEIASYSAAREVISGSSPSVCVLGGGRGAALRIDQVAERTWRGLAVSECSEQNLKGTLQGWSRSLPSLSTYRSRPP
jgi:hypothetical protein